MRTVLITLFTALLSITTDAALAGPQHGTDPSANTVSIRQNDAPLCGTPFYDALYALTVEVFAVGAGRVEVSGYEERVFALVRSAPEFAGNAEAFIEHIKDIPGQLVAIIREDPSVLDSCANFSIALVGPP